MTDAKQLTLTLRGKWHRHYGVAPCPVCQLERRKDQNALTINVKENRLLLHCKKSGCNFRDILVAANIMPGSIEIDALVMEDARRAREDQEAKTKARARAAWDQGHPLVGTHGETYLRSRGIACALPDTLRFHPECWHGPTAKRHPAMVARVDGANGFAIHRTYLNGFGGKANIPSNKMMLGPCAGGAVQVAAGVGPLVVAEGIETGLSLLSGLLDGPHSVWAALSTSGIKGLCLPPRPGDLILAADGDEPGREAANALARTAHALGWQVSLMPAPDGQDWNDVLQGEVAA